MAGGNGFGYLDTNKIIAVVPNLKRPQTFFLDRYFGNVQMSDTEFVTLDVEIGKRRMAPFVSPLVEGKFVESLGFQSKTFKPPYIKDKRAPDLRRPVRRAIGETIGGTMTGRERELANLEYEMTDQVQNLTRRMEWMAVSELATSTCVIAGEGFPTVTMDFGRDPTLTTALTGNGRWGVSANFNLAGLDPVPPATIQAAQRQILKKSGAKVTDIIFTTTPWQMFLNSVGVTGAIYYPRLGESGNNINPAPMIENGAVYMGRWGQYDLWVYNDWYVDENNVEQPMLIDGTVILASPEVMGVRAFAQIVDPEFAYEAMPFAPKTWINKDPAQRMLMMQSAPLPILGRPNASMAITVAAPVYF
jgi:hypothetical protein